MGLVRRVRRAISPASTESTAGGFPHRKAPYARARKLVAAGLVDLDWYRATADGKFPRAIDAAYHFYTQSRTQFSPHPILATSQQYDTKQYLDAVATYVDGFDEQWKFDKQLGPLPHPLFDDFKYVAAHPDAAQHPGGPRGHFAAHAKPSDTLPIRDDWDSAPVAVAAWRQALGHAAEEIVHIRAVRSSTSQHTPSPPQNKPPQASASGTIGRTEILVVIQGSDDPRATVSTARSILATTSSATIVISEPRTHLWTHATTAALMGGSGSLLWQRDAEWAGIPHVLAKITGSDWQPTSAIIFVRAGIELMDGCADALAKAITSDPSLLTIQPIILGANVGIRSAGKVLADTSFLPVDLIHGHPLEDAARIGSTIDVFAASDECFAVAPKNVSRITALVDVPVEGWVAATLSLQNPDGRTVTLADAHCCLVESGAVEPLPATGREFAHNRLQADHQLAVSLAAGEKSRADYQDYLRPLGMEVDSWMLRPRPRLRDLARVTAVPRRTALDDARPAQLRWSIHHMTPAGYGRRWWGDWYFAEDIARALRAEGQEVVLDWYGSRNRPTAHLDDVVLVLHGYDRVSPTPGAINILWIISHPGKVTAEEIAPFDLVYAASEPWAEYATRELGREVRPLLQAYDPGRFHPGLAAGAARDGVVFVGSGRQKYERPIIRDAIAAGLPVKIYGQYWDAQVPREYIAGRSYPNSELGSLYARSQVVLADHFPEMREAGFISNRVFEAVACGAHVICDDVPGLKDLFGDSVSVARDVPEIGRFWQSFQGDKPSASQVSLHGHDFRARSRLLIQGVTTL